MSNAKLMLLVQSKLMRQHSQAVMNEVNYGAAQILGFPCAEGGKGRPQTSVTSAQRQRRRNKNGNCAYSTVDKGFATRRWPSGHPYWCQFSFASPNQASQPQHATYLGCVCGWETGLGIPQNKWHKIHRYAVKDEPSGNRWLIFYRLQF